MPLGQSSLRACTTTLSHPASLGLLGGPFKVQACTGCVIANPRPLLPQLLPEQELPGPSVSLLRHAAALPALSALPKPGRGPALWSCELLLGSHGLAASAGPGAPTQLEPLSSSWIKTWKRSPCSCRTHQKRPPTLNRTTTKSSMTSSTWGISLRAQVRRDGAPGTWGPGYQTPAIHLPFYR